MANIKRLICFIGKQASDVYKGGFLVLLRKVYTLLLMAMALPAVLLVRALRPLVVIRFGQLRSGRIGHFAVNTELYLCERDLHLDSRRTFDIFFHACSISNYQLKKMWDRTLHVFPFARELSRVNLLLPGGANHAVETSTDRDIQRLLARTKEHLFFTPAEERLGQKALQGLGIDNGAHFVCFHARDPAYLNSVFPDFNWSYHNYRDSNINSYIPAIEELTRRRYFLIRMGAVVKEALSTSNPKIIDYAVNAREDFLDIYLGAKCHFFICDTAGIYGIAMIFRRPVAWVNYIPLNEMETWGKDDLYIPKKLWWREKHRFLTFREILDSKIAGLYSSEEYEQSGIEVIENTPEEIANLAVEMDERLKGKWQTTEEDEQLQRRFWALFKPSELNQAFLARIGAEFLRQNRELLEPR